MLNSDSGKVEDILIVVRPALKRVVCGNDAWRAAIFNQMLYNLVWAKREHNKNYWYNTYDYILNQLDGSFCKSKLIKEIKALVSDGLLTQEKMPGSTQMRRYSFTLANAAKMRKMCADAGVCVHCMKFPVEMLNYLFSVGVIDSPTACIHKPEEHSDTTSKSTDSTGKNTIRSSKSTSSDGKSTRSPNKRSNNDSNKTKHKKEEESRQASLFEPANADSASSSNLSLSDIKTDTKTEETVIENHETWNAEEALKAIERIVGKTYRNHEKQLKACQIILDKYKVDAVTFCRVVQRILPWWTSHKGLLHPTDLTNNTPRHNVRFEELLEDIEYEDIQGKKGKPTLSGSASGSATGHIVHGQTTEDYEASDTVTAQRLKRQAERAARQTQELQGNGQQENSITERIGA